ncbi:hypothetical protein [Salininema proteolyticum]|uniref:Uncharacterized protein n=1 Tax=Salininema proteolyticum TaxID=1607685 RepID=A0ABV8U433_9ACTN
MNQREFDTLRAYLRAEGWHLQPEVWRGSEIWGHPPTARAAALPIEPMGDGALRYQDAVRTIAEAENTTPADVLSKLSNARCDTQEYRVEPDKPSGRIGMQEAIDVLKGLLDSYRYSARSEIEGHQPTFENRAGTKVHALTRHLEIGPTSPGSYRFHVRMPLPPAPPQQRSSCIGIDGTSEPSGDRGTSSRHMVNRLSKSLGALRNAAFGSDSGAERGSAGLAFELVEQGVSSNLCDSLRSLSLRNEQAPFSARFAWAFDGLDPLPAVELRFPDGAGKRLGKLAESIRDLRVGKFVQVTGKVTTLSHKANDPYLFRVRETPPPDRPQKRMPYYWVECSPEQYNRAFRAQTLDHEVTVAGVLQKKRGRMEITIREDGRFEVIRLPDQ